MPAYLTDPERARLARVCALLVPPDGDTGAVEAGAVDYIDTLLGAFLFDPPRIWAGGPYSGRMGGTPGFADFEPLSAYEELAWRTRIEGSQGLPERERLGPIQGLQQHYSLGLASLGGDFLELDESEQIKRMIGTVEFTTTVYRHVCEGMYGAPEYGGNKGLRAWTYAGYLGDVQPRGYTDLEVSSP